MTKRNVPRGVVVQTKRRRVCVPRTSASLDHAPSRTHIQCTCAPIEPATYALFVSEPRGHSLNEEAICVHHRHQVDARLVQRRMA